MWLKFMGSWPLVAAVLGNLGWPPQRCYLVIMISKYRNDLSQPHFQAEFNSKVM